MNLDYVSGFFDADGSISMAYSCKTNPFKTIKIDFTNTKKSILIEIQKYLLTHGIKTYITEKVPYKENHSIGYTLSCSSNGVSIKLCKLLKSIHPMKQHRINTVLKYHEEVTSKNGKYTSKQYKRKLAYERLFHYSNFH